MNLRYNGGIKLGILKQEQNSSLIDLNRDIGSNLTLREFCNLIHNSEDGFVTVGTKDKTRNNLWLETTYPVKEWYFHLVEDENIGCFNSVNTMYKEHRSNNNVRHLNAFFVDIDTRNVGISKEDALAGIDFLVRNERLPEPTFVIDSGGGLYGIWKIETVPGKFRRTQKLYSLIEEFLIEELADLGADAKAKDPARVLRVPGTFNEKYQKRVAVLKHSDNVYTMRFFQEVMNEMNGVEWDPVTKTFPQKKDVQKKGRKNKIKRLFNLYTLAIARARDLKTLCKLRDYDLEGHRNTLLHIYAYQMMLIHQDSIIANERTIEFNDSLTEPLDMRELKSICRTVHRRYKDHLGNPSKGYNYRNSTIIRKLDITESEQRKMSTLINKKIKQERDTDAQRKRRRGNDGLTDKQREIKILTAKCIELKNAGLSIRAIAERLELTKSTVSRYLKAKDE